MTPHWHTEIEKLKTELKENEDQHKKLMESEHNMCIRMAVVAKYITLVKSMLNVGCDVNDIVKKIGRLLGQLHLPCVT